MSEIKGKINKALKSIAPKMDDESFEKLEQSLLQHGQWKSHPLTYSPDGDVCDGMNRFEIMQHHGIKPHYVIDETLKTFAEKKAFVIQNVLARRHLNTFQRGRLLLDLLAIEKKKAKKRQEELGRTHGKPSVQSETKGRATQIVADKDKTLSAMTLFKIEKIVKSNNNELIVLAETGKTTVNSAYNKIMLKEQPKRSPPMPKGVFNCICIDPPWRYKNQVTGGSNKSGARQKYPTLTPKQLKEKGKNWKKHFAKDCIMFMWAVTPLGKECQEVMESMGFKYKAKAYWIKDDEVGSGKLGMGYYLRGNVEELLIGVRGKVKAFRIQKKNYIISKGGTHSAKPSEFKTEIMDVAARRCFGRNARKLAMFERELIPGWTVYGDEVLLKPEITVKSKKVLIVSNGKARRKTIYNNQGKN